MSRLLCLAKSYVFLFDVTVLDDRHHWLDDEHISAAQHLLQEQHRPNMAGLQSITLQ